MTHTNVFRLLCLLCLKFAHVADNEQNLNGVSDGIIAGLPVPEGIHRHTGPSGGHDGGLLENVVGTQLHYHCHVDKT